MNIQKFIAIVAAIAINVAVLAWFHTVGAHAVANATPTGASAPAVTLPTTTVRPTKAQLEMLRSEGVSAGAGNAQARSAWMASPVEVTRSV